MSSPFRDHRFVIGETVFTYLPNFLLIELKISIKQNQSFYWKERTALPLGFRLAPISTSFRSEEGQTHISRHENKFNLLFQPFSALLLGYWFLVGSRAGGVALGDAE